MRILFLGNNWLGWQVVRWLAGRGEEIVGLVVHPPGRQKFTQEIVDSVNVDPPHVFTGSELHQPQVLDAIVTLRPDIGVSVMFGYLLRPRLLDLFPRGCVNLHPALLPYNRGAYPNVWSIVERTPAGVTLHYIDAGVDTGDIIVQRGVPVEPVDTGATLYRKLEQGALDLFQEAWPQVGTGTAPRHPQMGEGTYHRTRDVARIDEIHLDQRYTAREMIDIIRARTFPPHPGAYFVHGGRKVYLRLELQYEDYAGDAGGGEDHGGRDAH